MHREDAVRASGCHVHRSLGGKGGRRSRREDGEDKDSGRCGVKESSGRYESI